MLYVNDRKKGVMQADITQHEAFSKVSFESRRERNDLSPTISLLYDFKTF